MTPSIPLLTVLRNVFILFPRHLWLVLETVLISTDFETESEESETESEMETEESDMDTEESE